ncbi:MAG: right-handed parallel beta-helix repeat-containing protein [Planctomycetes bacterium]|nr:right-handed parallel beta-helix repeat-containing protein [Planctomycetota bacterium]
MADTILIHVEASAMAGGDGSAQRPFASLAAAQAAARARIRAGLTAPLEVHIAAGLFRLAEPLTFGPEDSGTAACPVTWRGVGGRPILSGGRLIEGWKEGTINGRACWQAYLPEVAAGRWWFTQLFVNGRRRLRARLPKQGFYHFTGVPADEAAKDPGTHFHAAMRACFAPGQLAAWPDLADVELVVPDHWYENHLRVAAVDETAGIVSFETKGWSRLSRDETNRHTRFRVDHVAAGCTDPGDWWLDRAAGVLHYIPKPGERIDNTVIEAPALERLLDLAGDPLDAARRVRHLRFAFLDLRHQEWEYPRSNPGPLQSAFSVPAAVRLVGAQDCSLHACRVSQVAGWAIEVLRGCQRNRVSACALHDLGGGGVKIGHEGGLPKGWVDIAFRGMDAEALGWGPAREAPGGLMPGRDASVASATTVSDCSIHDGGIIFHSAIGVWIGDAGRNRVVHNHISHFNYSGISCGWTWGFAPTFTVDNRIDGNRIEHIGHGMLSDMGGIYTLGLQPGTTIRRNAIAHVHSYGYGGWGIYPDEGSSWMLIEENVVCATKSGGFHQHYGRDNVVRRNVFAGSVENQLTSTRHEFVRPFVFTRNLVQGAGNGNLWDGGGGNAASIDHNVYAQEPGRALRFCGRSWDDWRALGQDQASSFVDACMLDIDGAEPAIGDSAALAPIGLTGEGIAAVWSEAGPRLRSVVPASIDGLPAETEVARAIIEPRLWPWAAEWLGADDTSHPFSSLPSHATVVSSERHPISLTVENRGTAPGAGIYRLRVEPPDAASIAGGNNLTFELAPGERASFDRQVIASGAQRTFRVECAAVGDGLFSSALHLLVVSAPQTMPSLSEVPSASGLIAALATLPPRPLAANPGTLVATVRSACAGRTLLVLVDAEDTRPSHADDPWLGSSVEVFIAGQRMAPYLQLVAAPAVAGRLPARVVLPKTRVEPPEVTVVSQTTPRGWRLALAIPLSLAGVDPAAKGFAYDLVVSAVPAGASDLARRHLASELNPYIASTEYLAIILG